MSSLCKTVKHRHFLTCDPFCRTNGIPPSPPHSPTFGHPQEFEHFSPSSSDLCDRDSVVLSVDGVTPYLDKSLRSLGLHTEARTSFITCVKLSLYLIANKSSVDVFHQILVAFDSEAQIRRSSSTLR